MQYVTFQQNVQNIEGEDLFPIFALVWPGNVIAMSGESNFTIKSVINYVVTFYVRGYSNNFVAREDRKRSEISLWS